MILCPYLMTRNRTVLKYWNVILTSSRACPGIVLSNSNGIPHSLKNVLSTEVLTVFLRFRNDVFIPEFFTLTPDYVPFYKGRLGIPAQLYIRRVGEG